MIRSKTIIIAILITSITSCYKNYKVTARVCNSNLYEEIYEVTAAGVYASYLTDSISFRIYIGKYDPESGYYNFICKGDSLYIEKLSHRDSFRGDTVNIVVSRRTLNLKSLKKK